MESEPKMSRDEMIALLVCDTLERVMNRRQVFWLQGVLENGLLGFAKWSDEELRRELDVRGFRPDEHASAVVEDYEAADDLDDNEFIRFSGHLGSGSNWQIPHLHESFE